MRKHYLDYEKTKEVYEYSKPHIEFKQCYNNVFNVVTDYIATFRSGEWKVAYGYVEVMSLVYCRHCFIVDESGKVIDPTICTNTDPNTDRDYLVMKIFDDIDEYFTAIERENYYPALDRTLKENTAAAQKWANENGVILTG